MLEIRDSLDVGYGRDFCFPELSKALCVFVTVVSPAAKSTDSIGRERALLLFASLF